MTSKSTTKGGPRSSPVASGRGLSSGPKSSARRRVAGVMIPLFSLRCAEDWGIGELTSLPPFASWLKEEAGIGLVQVLPLTEISGAETSPYAALTAFGFDPMYIAPEAIPDLAGQERAALGDDGLAALAAARAAPAVDYGMVRAVKQRALRFAFRRFTAEELGRGSPRALAFLSFVGEHAAWICEYALFRALKDAHDGRAWWDWEPSVRDRHPGALDAARHALGSEMLFYEYLQWIAHGQWSETRKALHAIGVEVMGDMPFMVGRDSADVWSRPTDFKLNGSVGAPPDAFSDEGQDWDLPPYDWEAMQANDYAWHRARARHMGAIFDRFRIDHLVGFYRTYQRNRATKRDARGRLVPGVFDPAAPEEQRAHGERVVGAMRDAAAESGATLVAEDLGVVPDFVRASITKLRVPGYRVLIWEKDGDVFRDPRSYPALSLACFGTHDTPPVSVWWEELGAAERAAFAALPALAGKRLPAKFTADVQAALFELLASSPSSLALFAYQDLAASPERINTPGTTGARNWTYRLPVSVEAARSDPGMRQRLARIRAVLLAAGRR